MPRKEDPVIEEFIKYMEQQISIMVQEKLNIEAKIKPNKTPARKEDRTYIAPEPKPEPRKSRFDKFLDDEDGTTNNK